MTANDSKEEITLCPRCLHYSGPVPAWDPDDYEMGINAPTIHWKICPVCIVSLARHNRIRKAMGLPPERF